MPQDPSAPAPHPVAAGPGYDLVTGLGTPKANLLIPSLSAYGLASTTSIATQPPPSVVTGANFGIIASATDSAGATDVGYNGTATLTAAARAISPAARAVRCALRSACWRSSWRNTDSMNSRSAPHRKRARASRLRGLSATSVT